LPPYKQDLSFFTRLKLELFKKIAVELLLSSKMNQTLEINQTKTISKQLYDALLAYLIQSSKALDATARDLASDPRQASSKADILNESLASAKVLLSKVSHILS
jgi:hypothetical protein